ncbi:hypothetical protein O59_002468 [Cellvibrio sp. BR]|nr:hypothetical protein O59_002468 [Cellvibrio sp. BR]
MQLKPQGDVIALGFLIFSVIANCLIGQIQSVNITFGQIIKLKTS